MEGLLQVLEREAVYLWYYADLQVRQIFRYWVFGILIGSAVAVFVKAKIHGAAEKSGGKFTGVISLVFASLLGIASPLCMYGTIPICAAFSRKGVRDDFLASFMMSSVLLNPQLILYSGALGPAVLFVRIAGCFLCGICAGILVRIFFYGKPAVRTGKSGGAVPAESKTSAAPENAERKSFFEFSAFSDVRNRDTGRNILLRFIKNVLRNIRATGPMFILGIILSALFQRYVPSEAVAGLFGEDKGFGSLMAAAVGVPLYVCGGGTIPLLQQWLATGMSIGSAASFMIAGPSTKITNLGALKTALGTRNFVLYFLYAVGFSSLYGIVVNAVL